MSFKPEYSPKDWHVMDLHTMAEVAEVAHAAYRAEVACSVANWIMRAKGILDAMDAPLSSLDRRVLIGIAERSRCGAISNDEGQRELRDHLRSQ